MGQEFIFPGDAKLMYNGVEIGTVSMVTVKKAKEAKQDVKAK